MGRENKADRQQIRALKGLAVKKPYVKPVLRRLGTVRELTQFSHSKGTK